MVVNELCIQAMVLRIITLLLPAFPCARILRLIKRISVIKARRTFFIIEKLSVHQRASFSLMESKITHN